MPENKKKFRITEWQEKLPSLRVLTEFKNKEGDTIAITPQSLECREILNDVFSFKVVIGVTHALLDLSTLPGSSFSVVFDPNPKVLKKVLDEEYDIIKKEYIYPEGEGGDPRYFHGVIGQCRQLYAAEGQEEKSSVYEVICYPKFWLLNFISDCRIFQNQTPKEIVSLLLEESTIDFALSSELKTKGGRSDEDNKREWPEVLDEERDTREKKDQETNDAPTDKPGAREFCVQYNESTFAFINRLLEENGLTYYFVHDDLGHKMIILDPAQGFPDIPNVYAGRDQMYIDRHNKRTERTKKKIRPLRDSMLTTSTSNPFVYQSTQMDSAFMAQILECRERAEVVPGAARLGDYNYLKTDDPLQFTSSAQEPKSVDSFHNQIITSGQVYSYPGLYKEQTDGEALARLRLESVELPQFQIEGSSTIHLFNAGHQFSMDYHPVERLNQVDFSLYEVHHSIKMDPSMTDSVSVYQNTFIAFPKNIHYAPLQKTKKPIISSVQTAVVTGQENTEIWTDDGGRIKLKFFWDTKGPTDDKSSCWIRVASGWAGSGWGIVSTPRVGQEVVVTFLEGNPDRPLVVGCVYNGTNKPPYLPDEPTKSTWKSNSTKNDSVTPEESDTSDRKSNEIRFDDMKGSEEFFIHAQKDMNEIIENDHSLTVQTGNQSINVKKGNIAIALDASGDKNGNLTTKLSRGDHSLTLSDGNKTTEIQKGNDTLSVVGTRTISVSKDEEHSNETNFKHDVTENYVLKIGGNLTIDVSGNIKISAGGTIKTSSSGDTTLSSGADMKIKSIADLKLNAGADCNVMASGDAGFVAGGACKLLSGGDATISAGMALDMKANTGFKVMSMTSAEITALTTMNFKATATFGITAAASISIETVGMCKIAGGPMIDMKAAMINLN